MSDAYGIRVTQDLEESITDADMMVIAVKPQNCDVVFEELRQCNDVMKKDATLLSIVAGVPMHKILSGTGMHKIARSMPNTPATIGKGMTVFTTKGVDDEERRRIKEVLSSFGKAVSLLQFFKYF